MSYGNPDYYTPPPTGPPPPGYPQHPHPQQAPYPSHMPYGQQPPMMTAPPPQGPYPPPSAPYPSQQHGYPPQQQGFPSQQQGFPQQQQGYPPQQAYIAPPYGAPPGGQYPPPSQQFPPQQQYFSQPTPPSIGYDPSQTARVDTTRDVEQLRKAMKGLGTDEKSLIAVLARIPDPLIMANVRQTYSQRFMKDLLAVVASETSGHFGETCEALVRGPLDQDAFVLHEALQGAGTREAALDDVLLGRSNADLRAVKATYQRHYHRSLESDVAGDLSAKTKKLFEFVLSATRQEESAPAIPQQIEAAAAEVHRATVGVKLGTDQITVCQIFASHSDGQLRAISQAYEQRYRTPLAKIIEDEFSGHMKHALLRMLHVAQDRAKADVEGLEESMRGMGTKDNLLLNRLVRLHWQRDHFDQVKRAYKHFHKRDLAERVKGETSGDYGRMLLAIVG